MEKRNICLIFDCDEWKTRATMHLICACEPEFLPEFLKKIQSEKEYTDDEMQTYIFVEHITLNEL